MASPNPPPPLAEPDDKDWTWTLERVCPDCGFAAAEVSGPEVGAYVLHDLVHHLHDVGARPTEPA